MFDFRFDHGRGKVDEDAFAVGSSSGCRPPYELFIGAERYNDSAVFLAGFRWGRSAGIVYGRIAMIYN